MNQKAIKKHFLEAWKERVVIARTNDGKLWLSDVYSLVTVKETDLVLESRRVFPKIPKIGESLWASKSGYFQGRGPDVEELIERSLKEDYKPLELTNWFQFNYPVYVRMFETQDDRKIFVNANLLDLIVSDDEEISNFQFFGTTPDGCVLVKDKQDELIALIAPMRNADQILERG